MQYTPMCLKSAQDCVHGAHAGRRWNRLGGHTGGGSGGGPVSKLLPLADVGGGAKDGLDVVVIQLWSEMERGPHLVRCAGLLLLLAGVGAQKKLLEKVLKKTTTLKPRLLQTSDGKHCRSSPDVATRSLGLNVNDKSLNIQRANFMGLHFSPQFCRMEVFPALPFCKHKKPLSELSAAALSSRFGSSTYQPDFPDN